MVKKDTFKVVYRRNGNKSKLHIDENDAWMDVLGDFLDFISRQDDNSPGYIITPEIKNAIVDFARGRQAEAVRALIAEHRARAQAEATEAKAAAEILLPKEL